MPPISGTNAKAPSQTSRRAFVQRAASCCGGTALLASGSLMHAVRLLAEPPSPPATPTRPDVAAIDHGRLPPAAERYLKLEPPPLTSLPCPRSPGTAHDYYSEAEPKADS